MGVATLEVWGGAGEHGRACYRVANGPISVLLDCGGKRTAGEEYPLWKPEAVPKLTTAFLSHAHEDHSAGLPILHRMGYRGDVWTTRATARRLASTYRSWRQYAAGRSETPFHDGDEGQLRFRYLEDAAPEGEWFEAAPDVQACWGPSGHMIGSVWILLDVAGCKVFYSGDYTSESSLLRAGLPAPDQCNNLEAAIVDAAYGVRTDSQADVVAQLVGKIREVGERGGHVLLPVPLHGRGPELLVLLAEALPESRLVGEEALLQGLAALREESAWLLPDAVERIGRAVDRLRRQAVAESEGSSTAAGSPAILFVPDAQLQTERAQAIYRRLFESNDAAAHAVIFTGHVYGDSYAGKLVDRAGERPPCGIHRIPYKIHQGLPEVWRMLERLKPRALLPVHADKEKTDRLVEALAERGYAGAVSLAPGQAATLTAEADA